MNLLVICILALCLLSSESVESFVTPQKLAEVERPLFTAKVQFAKDAEVANQAVHPNNGAFNENISRSLKEDLLQKKILAITSPIINLKQWILARKLSTLEKMIPTAATFSHVQSTLETIGKHVPFLNTLTNGVSSFHQFVPKLESKPNSNFNYESNSAVDSAFSRITGVAVKDTYGPPVPSSPVENYGPPSPYPPPAPVLPELPTLPNIEYGVPTTTTTSTTTTTPTPLPPQGYGPPPALNAPKFKLPSFSYIQRF